MLERIILLSGPVSSGKSALARDLAERYGMSICKTRELLQDRIPKGLIANRKTLQEGGDRLDVRSRGRWVREAVSAKLREMPSTSAIIVDSVRIAEQIQAIRDAFGPIVIHIHLTAPIEELRRRYEERRKSRIETQFDYSEVRENKTEQEIETLAQIADVVIDTNRCTGEDVLMRGTRHLKVRTGSGTGYVDVIIGGQYGSEGKGQIASYLAREYDLLIRVGGPNAGHKVYEEPEPYPHHQLPSGTRKSAARLLLGPGAVISMPQLLKEIADCKVDAERLSIDQNAMIISDNDVEREGMLVQGIGSTGQGVGAATARRILERTPSTRLARDIPELQPYLGNALEILEDVFSKNGKVMLEGTQGTGLSLYHGSYPYVTSRDTTVAGCLAEAGIPPTRVRKVVMVCRTYPIRVANPKGGTSGPITQEILWKVVAERSGKSLKEIRQTEKTTTTHRRRRVGEFDWALLCRSALLNGPTDIVLTFTDYLSKANGSAKRFEQLTPETINFIVEVERVAGAPVSLISTGFSHRSIIDRRSW